MGRKIRAYKRKKSSKKQKRELQELNNFKNTLIRTYYSIIENTDKNIKNK